MFRIGRGIQGYRLQTIDFFDSKAVNFSFYNRNNAAHNHPTRQISSIVQ